MINRYFILTIVLFLFHSNSYAQNYTPIIINGEVFFKTELETSGGFVFSEITVANFEKINGVLYNRVFFKVGFDPDMLIGHLREEPGMGRLFFRPESSEEDFLVYDISLEIGDQISLSARWCDGISGNIATVTEVTNTEGARTIIFDRQIGLSETCETLRFIEGVGSNASVIFPYFLDEIPVNGTALRLCHVSHQNVIFYPENVDTDFCGLVIPTATVSPSNQALILFPNPVKDRISFLLEEGIQVKNIIIYNTLGQEILFNSSTTMDVSSLEVGVYYLVVGASDGNNYSGRFVKK